MSPEYLYKKNDLWFSLSWDWRDRYLEVSLDRLHWFKDVMPRVVVIGDFASYNSKIQWNSFDKENEEIVLKRIADSLEESIEKYKIYYPKIYENFLISRGKRKGLNIDEYIGKEVEDKELDKFSV